MYISTIIYVYKYIGTYTYRCTRTYVCTLLCRLQRTAYKYTNELYIILTYGGITIHTRALQSTRKGKKGEDAQRCPGQKVRGHIYIPYSYMRIQTNINILYLEIISRRLYPIRERIYIHICYYFKLKFLFCFTDAHP